MALLELTGLTKRFGGLTAVNKLNLSVREKEILGLIGPNGAGKSTVFNTISGVHAPTSGRVVFRGEDVTRLPPHAIARKGIVRTFQATTLFHDYSLLDNVRIARHLRLRAGVWASLLHTPGYRAEEADNAGRAEALLEIVGLRELGGELAKNLPHGHQRALGVAIAMASDPILLMLDEPLTGMNREEAGAMARIIRRIRGRGITIILVEHDMRAVMDLCDRIAVLNYGNKIAEGSPEEIRENREVIEAYLGTEARDA
jgi:branched-chain amino acid transport system ATP-binding protein